MSPIRFSRRTAMMAATASLSAPALLTAVSSSALAQAPAAAGQAPGFYRYKLGDITLTAINDGFFRRPLEGFVRNAELPAVQEAMRAAFLPTDAVPIPFTTLVVQSGSRVILLDTANGDNGAPTSGTWMANFRAAGFDPAQVTDIVISHFHGDHIGGIRAKAGSLNFPNATIQVPTPEWAFWMSDERMNAAPDPMKGAFMNVRRVFAPIAANVKQFTPGAEVAPGVLSFAAHGHSPGHCVFGVQSGTQRMMFMADVTNHPALFVKNPDWSAVFDQDADAARAVRRRMLDMAASERALVAFYHAPFPATGYIAKDGNGFNFVPVQWSTGA